MIPSIPASGMGNISMLVIIGIFVVAMGMIASLIVAMGMIASLIGILFGIQYGFKLSILELIGIGIGMVITGFYLQWRGIVTT